MSTDRGDAPVEEEKQPRVDHRAHLTRIGLEIAQLISIGGSLLSVVRTGVSGTTIVVVCVTVALTVYLARTPRPPLPGEPPDRKE